MSQQKQRLEWCNAHFEGEEGTTKQGSQTVSSNWKSQGTESPLDPPDGASSAHTVTLAQWDPQGTSNFQNCKIINVCCFSSYRKTDTDTPVDSSHWPCHSVLFSSSRRRNKLWLTNYGVRPWKSLTHSLSYLFFKDFIYLFWHGPFKNDPGSSNGKESACSAEDLGFTPESGRSPGEGKGHSLQYSCLENSMDGGAWWTTIHGLAKSQTQLSY